MADIPLYAKQPILDNSQKVIGYELLFRPSEDSSHIEGDVATASVVLNSMMTDDPVIHDESVALYLNCSEEWFLNPIPFNRKNTVLEVLETVIEPSTILNSLLNAKAEGFRIALDDFLPELPIAALIPHADIVKVDIRALTKPEIAKVVKELKQKPLTLLAEKVENQEEFLYCKSLGFDLYQGYFFAKPEIKFGKKLQSNVLAAIDMMSELAQAEPIIDNILNHLKKDVVLTTRILAIANSSAYAPPRPVSTLQQAVVNLGLRRLNAIVGYVLLSELNSKPDVLVVQTLTTALTLEKVASAQKVENPNTWFLVGFLSKINVFFDLSYEDAFKQLSVDLTIIESITHKEHEAGKYLSIVENAQIGDWEKLKHDQCFNGEIFSAMLEAESESRSFFL